MRPHDLEALDYPQVLVRVAEFAQSAAGAAAVRGLRPHAELSAVAEALEQTWQVFRLLETEGTCPSTAVPDIAARLAVACHEGFGLDGPSLVDVRRVLAAGREIASYLRQRRDRVPALAPLLAQLRPLGELEAVLARALDDDGVLRDGASEELTEARAAQRRIRASLTRRLEALVTRATMADVVAEQYVTLRNNRFVIPVKAHYAQKLHGVVQDRSASGETLFLEPLFAVEMNNDLLVAAQEEERITRRILDDLTGLVRVQAAEIGATFAVLTAFDAVVAKARFGQRYRCTQPELTDGAIDLRDARHPVLMCGDRPVVAVHIQLPPDKQALVITGPNTGGKTVALKTLGVLSAMAQTGLLIPAAEGSRLPVWGGIHADIGDEQNLQRNLSTFSAHLANLIDIERVLEPPALVLLDEPGVGTDPEEGAALAIGLIAVLARRGARVAATTHYTAVKLYAVTQDAWVAAAVDFDRATLAPLYRLIYHSLGESLGLPMAEQLGLSPEVLAAARGAQTVESKTLGAALERLETSRRGYEARLEGVAARERAVAEQDAEAARLLRDLRERQRDKWRTELAAARDFVRDLKDEGRRLLAALEHRRASRRELAQFADRAAAAIDDHQATMDTEAAPAGPLHPGDLVELAGGGFRGELVSLSGDRAWIRRGTMRIEARATQLRRVQPAPPAPQPAPAPPRREDAPAEVTLIGLRAKEALAKLESFLDAATLAGHASIRIVHGVGSGALRRAVQEYLETSPYCGTFRDGAPNEGGAGVTVAELGA